MPPQDHKPDEFDKTPGRNESAQEGGEFTRAFGGRPDHPPDARPFDAHPFEDAPSPQDEETQDALSPAPGSLTELLGGKPKQSSPLPQDRRVPPPPPAPGASGAQPAASFTSAFDGLNAFTRDPADRGEFNLGPLPGKPPHPDAGSPEPPGSFTRLFGSGEGVLTPSGTGERPQPPVARSPGPSGGGLPGFSPPESARDRNTPPRPAEIESGAFTQAFQSAPVQPEPKMQAGEFTEVFGPPQSRREPEPPPRKSAPAYPSPTYPAPTYPARPAVTSPGHPLPDYNAEPALPSNPQRTPAAPGGFTRLIDTLRPDPSPPPDSTLSSMRPGPPDHSLPDLNFTPRGSAPEGGATVVFNASRQPEPEVSAPQGKSEYTMVVERSSLRQPVQPAGTGVPQSGGPQYGAGAAPPTPPQYPQIATPPAPAWTPPAPAWAPPAPAPPWQPPQPPVMPQAPTFAPPAPPVAPPTLGDKLVSFLPLMLALTVINFLGLLAVLIILFATRK